MHNIRFAEKNKGGHAVPHLYLIRHDGVVHVISYTEGPSIVFVNNGTPVNDVFHMYTRCGKTVKMYCGGLNKITHMHPTCIRCLGESQIRGEVVIFNE